VVIYLKIKMKNLKIKNLKIRYKITIWYTVLLLILLVIFNVFIYTIISSILNQSVKGFLKSDAKQVFSIIQSEGYNIHLDIPYRIIDTNVYFVVFDANGNTGFKSSILPQIVNLPIGQEQLRFVLINGTKWIVYDTPVLFNGNIIGWIRVSRSLQYIINALSHLKIIMFTCTPIYIILASLGGLFLANKALKPIDFITKTAQQISKGDLSQRLKLDKTEDEVGRLAVTFDYMLDKLESSIKKERQFASDASHELRTPISVITAQAEQALLGSRKIKEYKEALEIIRDESKKMQHIISQLLMITRSDEGTYNFNFEILNLNIIMEDILKEFKKIADNKKIKIYYESKDNIKIKADQTLLTRLFINIIDNAIKYTNEFGEIKVNMKKEDNFCITTIEDTGIGISQEDLPYIFNRLYQVDKSRSDRGAGLGLSIAKWIVELHKGELKVESKLNYGSKFIIKLPLNI